MIEHFDLFLKRQLNAHIKNKHIKNLDFILDEQEILYLYSKIVDKVIVKMFNNMVEDEKMQKSFKKLSSLQRMVILFNVILDFSLKDTSIIIDSSLNSIKSQKSKAVKRLKKELGDS